MKSPIVLLEGLLADAGRLMPDVKGLDRDVITIKHRYENEGIGFLTVALPTLCDSLDRGLADCKFACPIGFSKPKGGAIPKLFSGMLCKVFVSTTGLLVEEPDLSIVKILREILRLFKKLALESDRESLLDQQAKDRFIQDDRECLDELLFNETESFILDRVCSFILPNIETFDESQLKFKHGPGAVFERYRPNQKWSSLLTYSSELDHMGFDIFYNSDAVVDDSMSCEPLAEYGVSSDVARLTTVEKSSTSRRTITVEPVVRQFVQQGLNTLLRDSINKCAVLSQCLALTDQSKNQHLAMLGSITGEWSTIDLRSASDLLSLRLVEKVFRSKPLFLERLLSCRAPKVVSGSSTFTLRKYAGMGNATTFPIQSVVFTVIVISALLKDKRLSYRNVKHIARQIRIYGDDIIVRTESVHQVLAWLRLAGLTVNEKKSFTTGNFRESCGTDAYFGVDVTPLYLKCWPDRPSLKEPSSLAHLVEFGNQAWLRGLYSMSGVIRDWVDNSLRKPLPLVSKTSPGLGWHTHQGSVDIQRWNKHLHRFEVLVPVVSSLKRRDNVDGRAALLKAFHVPLLGRERDHLRKSPVKDKKVCSLRWVPSLT